MPLSLDFGVWELNALRSVYVQAFEPLFGHSTHRGTYVFLLVLITCVDFGLASGSGLKCA